MTATRPVPPDGGPRPDQDWVVSVFARACASRGALEDIGTKWGFLALLALRENDYRFNALRRRVDGVSEKMLAQTLQTLERDGLVVRDVVTAIPPRVHYSLTGLGARVAEHVAALTSLLEEAVPEIAAAQARFDNAAQARFDNAAQARFDDADRAVRAGVGGTVPGQ